jgi:dihydropyrimidinase
MLAAYQDWRRKAEGAACDYGFHMAVTSWKILLQKSAMLVVSSSLRPL